MPMGRSRPVAALYSATSAMSSVIRYMCSMASTGSSRPIIRPTSRAHRPPALAMVADPGVLVDLGSGLPRAAGVGPGDPGRVDVTLDRVEERADEVLLLQQREQLLGFGRRDDLHIYAEVAAAGLSHPQPVHPLPVTGQRQPARHVDAAVPAGALLDLPVQPDGVLLQLRDIGVTVERVHAARGVPGRAGGELLALDEYDIGPAQLGEVEQDRGAHHATADDDHLRGRFHRGIPASKFSRYSRSDYRTLEVSCNGKASRSAGRRTGDLRRGVFVRVRAARLPAGRGVRAGGGARGTRYGRRAAPGIRACRL